MPNPMHAHITSRSKQSSDAKVITIAIDSASLQPFTARQWRLNQQYIIKTVPTKNTPKKLMHLRHT
ncbi:hypothetical protein L1049_015303 [Liquidambar formosana]|uniref:Uncharacterized protein n=1 Tax=Liquidambar formosana TaxID=63359 RepID=A0AAP0RXP6_LIQFO